MLSLLCVHSSIACDQIDLWHESKYLLRINDQNRSMNTLCVTVKVQQSIFVVFLSGHTPGVNPLHIHTVVARNIFTLTRKANFSIVSTSVWESLMWLNTFTCTQKEATTVSESNKRVYVRNPESMSFYFLCFILKKIDKKFIQITYFHINTFNTRYWTRASCFMQCRPDCIHKGNFFFPLPFQRTKGHREKVKY